MDRIAIITATLYVNKNTKTRFCLARRFIKNAIDSGYKIMVVDNSPDCAVRYAFSEIGARVFKQKTKKGYGNQKRELFNIAADDNDSSEIFLWTEPEKTDLIRWIPKIIDPIQSGQADIVIPKRTETSYASYPKFQVKSEQRANSVYKDITGKNFDMMFGPVAFSCKVLSYFRKCNPESSYGVVDSYIQNIAAMEAMADGFKAVSVPVDFIYPEIQRIEEETTLFPIMRDKRQKQFSELTNVFYVVTKKLKIKK